MQSPSLRLGVLTAGAAVVFGVCAFTLQADSKPAAVAEIKDVMNSNNHKVDGLYGMIKACLKADQPDAKAWKMAAHRAAIVAEGGNILMGLTPPKGGDDDAGKAKWAAHAAAFRDAAKEVMKACKMKKLEEARAAAAVLEKQCDACHADHQNE
jgi:hypothetical protein